MAYADLLDDETASSHYLIVLTPRRYHTGFSVFSGSVYSSTFDYGEVVGAWADGLELTQASSTSLNADEFYFDPNSNTVYVRLTSGANPDTIFLTLAYEIYAGTTSAHWYRVPTDDTTRVVFFDPIVSKSPQFKSSSTDLSFGFNPIQKSNLTVINAEHFLDRHLHDSSFFNADCVVYHWLGELDTANISKVLAGFTTSVSFDPPRVTFQIADRFDLLSQEWRHPTGSDNFFFTSSFANLDPNSFGVAIPKIYGLVTGGITPVNIDYVLESPTTSDNRDWVVCTGQTGLADVSQTVSAAPASTATRTYLDNLDGLNVGDSIWLDKATDEYATITALGANYIDHTTIVTPATTGELVKRAFVSAISIVQNNVEYKALYNRDYTISTAFNGNTSGFSFRTTLEANLSMPATLSPNDTVICRAYGPRNNLTLGGPAFGTDDTRTDNMAHPAQVTLDILKTHLGVAEADLDSASFTQALTDQDSGVGFIIPFSSKSKTFPKYKDVISKLCASTLSKLLIDQVGLFSIFTLAPFGAANFSVSDDEILSNSISFDYDYNDLISEAVVNYAIQQRSAFELNQVSSAISVTSDTATYLHMASKSREEDSVWIYEAEATNLANHLSFIYGDRLGSATIKVKNRFYDSKLGDVVDVSRVYLPGFDVDGETEFTRSYSVEEIIKGRTEITLTLQDFKGIDDNSGGW